MTGFRETDVDDQIFVQSYAPFKMEYQDFIAKLQYYDPQGKTKQSRQREIYKKYLKTQEDDLESGLKQGKYFPYHTKKADGSYETLRTVGFGHQETAEERAKGTFALGLDKQGREDLLDKDISWKMGVARDKYDKDLKSPGAFNKLPSQQQYALTDYAYTGTKGVDLPKLIKNNALDSAIIKEAIKTQWTPRRKKGLEETYGKIKAIESGDENIQKLLLSHKDFIKFRADDIIQKRFDLPTDLGFTSQGDRLHYSHSVQKEFLEELAPFEDKFHNGTLTKKDLDGLIATIGSHFRETIGRGSD